MNILLIFLLAQTYVTKKASCTIDNKPYLLMHKDGTYEDKDDWYVTCRVTVGDKVVESDRVLPLAHPTEFPEAAQAAREFVKKNKQ